MPIKKTNPHPHFVGLFMARLIFHRSQSRNHCQPSRKNKYDRSMCTQVIKCPKQSHHYIPTSQNICLSGREKQLNAQFGEDMEEIVRIHLLSDFES